MLTQYLTQTALLLDDPSNTLYDTTTLTTFVNLARRWISIRILQPRVLVTTLSTVNNQETYALSLATTAVQAVAGISKPYGVYQIAVNEGNYMVSLGRKDFPSFTADDRILNGTLVDWPIKFSTYGIGATQTIYMFPVPSGAYSMWWDVACLPINLASDTDVEALPDPWPDIVPFFAARYCVMTQQRWQDAQGFRNECDAMLLDVARGNMPYLRPEWYSQER